MSTFHVVDGIDVHKVSVEKVARKDRPAVGRRVLPVVLSFHPAGFGAQVDIKRTFAEDGFSQETVEAVDIVWGVDGLVVERLRCCEVFGRSTRFDESLVLVAIGSCNVCEPRSIEKYTWLTYQQ